MFSYYGSKSKIIDKYPSPKFDKVIEPFAGSARYALKWWDRDVLLVDKYDVIVHIWEWLISASQDDIINLPTVQPGDDIRSLPVSDTARMFMGFMINGGSATPKNIVKGFQKFNYQKYQIAKSLHKIRHWKVILGDYRNIENENATWFIDPPYQYGGKWYKENIIDYNELANWCKSRLGQTIVCENTKADWMNFYPIGKLKGQLHTTTEAVWSNYPHDYKGIQANLF